MPTGEDQFLALLRSTFRIEASEHLQTLTNGFLELERAAGAEAKIVIERVFRAAHTLKGAARAVDLPEIESLCQLLEDVFASWKRGESTPSTEGLDEVHRSLDAIALNLAQYGEVPAATPLRPAPAADSRPAMPVNPPLSHRIGPETPLLPPSVNVAIPEKNVAVPQATVRVSVAKLEGQLLQAEEILTAKLSAAQRARDLGELAVRLESWRNGWSAVETDVRSLRQRQTSAPLTRLLDFFDWTAETLRSIENRVATLDRNAVQDHQTVSKLVDELLEESKRLLLMPFSTISAAFPKCVRDISRDQRKDAELTIQGEDVELDKRILEELKDPILHLLRNSIDHGIESVSERLEAGKPPRATISLTVSQIPGNKVEVTLSDDGVGINAEHVKESAVRHGALSKEEADRLTAAEALQLIFRSGVTTSNFITQLSGRGLGLAIVREKAETLGGEVTVDSQAGAGTTFRLVIPSTRATFRGILVQVAGQQLIVPTMQVERVGRIDRNDVRTVQGRETISLDGRAVPLVGLAEVLELPRANSELQSSDRVPIVVLGSGDHRIAFAVEAVVDEQEILVKPLRKPLSRVRNVAAATVLGSGNVAPILNVADLLKSAQKFGRALIASEVSRPTAPSQVVLVAEDSITSRMLLKSILESAGYQVKTAIDGLEAFTLLRSNHFDLLVSDVEMPRLNGFDLTSRIRADPKLAELPVILVTALETREDRERGVEAGANAYIVKGTFDQSDLLDAARRLI